MKIQSITSMHFFFISDYQMKGQKGDICYLKQRVEKRNKNWGKVL